jgi:hypothetical protein
LIYLYPEKPSIRKNIAFPTMNSMMISIFGSGKSSFGKALLRSLKFLQIQILLLGFEIGTILEI